MFNHIWSVLCTKSIVDSTTNNISLIEVIESIGLQINQFPPDGSLVLPMTLELVSLWSRSNDNTPANGTARMIYCSPSGREIKSSEIRVDLTGTYTRTRTRIAINGLPLINETGKYIFKVQMLNGETESWMDVAKLPLSVTFTQSA